MKKQNKKQLIKEKTKKPYNHLSYLKESKKQIKIIAILFFAAILFGFIFAKNLTGIEKVLREIIKQASGLEGIPLIAFIFFNNALTSLFGMILGMFLGIFPIITSTYNGVIIGYVLRITVENGGILELWRLFPHGIFELPAVFISLGLGLKLSSDIIKNYIKSSKSTIMNILGIISMIIALGSLSLLKLALTTAINAQSSPSPTIAYTFSAILIIFSLLLLFPFISLFFLIDKKIRKFNFQKLSLSLQVFLRIVIPLLLIAAIIEGLLITAL